MSEPDGYVTQWSGGIPVTVCTRCDVYVWDSSRHEAHAHSVPKMPVTIVRAAAGLGKP